MSFLDADLEGANFERAILDRAEFINCGLVSARFADAKLAGTIF